MKAFPRDIDVKTLNERHVGIESELFVGEGGGHVTPELLEKIRCRGLSQDIGWDGGGREFRTYPIRCKSLKQVRGCKYLKEYFAHLKSDTKVVRTGGTHIHISILDKDHVNMESNAAALATAFFEQFQKIAGRKSSWAGKLRVPNGRTNAWGDRSYGEPRSIEEIREYISQRKQQNEDRVYAMKGSILNPTYHKTLEFRGPKGSNDAEEILAWIEFLENVVKKSNRKCVNGTTFGDLIKGERIESYITSLKGWRKLTKTDLNKTINVNALV